MPLIHVSEQCHKSQLLYFAIREYIRRFVGLVRMGKSALRVDKSRQYWTTLTFLEFFTGLCWLFSCCQFPLCDSKITLVKQFHSRPMASDNWSSRCRYFPSLRLWVLCFFLRYCSRSEYRAARTVCSELKVCKYCNILYYSNLYNLIPQNDANAWNDSLILCQKSLRFGNTV